MTTEEEKKRSERKSRFRKELTNSSITIMKKGTHAGAQNHHIDEEDLNFELLSEKWKIKVKKEQSKNLYI